MKDIIFLFGAGASFGAGGILPEQPPLGSQLYPILEHIYPGTWGSLPNEIKAVLQEDFEKGMQLVYDHFGSFIPLLMRDMAIYFVQFRPYHLSTLYCRLISDLQRLGILSRIMFSTLNYDCVLEHSLTEQRVSISYFDEGDLQTVPVWKLHGSCNMFSQGIQAGQGVSYGTGVIWEGGVEAFLDSDKVIQHCLLETGLAPVMCLYMREKPLSVSPSVIQQLQQEWARKVGAAVAVICIGVRPLVEDTHIWEPLAASQAQLYFIGDNAALSNWHQAARNASTEYLGSRFNYGYSQLLERLTSYAIN